MQAMNADSPTATRRLSKRPLRYKACGWCDQPLEQAAKGRCGRIWHSLPDGTELPECFWVSAIREHGPHRALEMGKKAA